MRRSFGVTLFTVILAACACHNSAAPDTVSVQSADVVRQGITQVQRVEPPTPTVEKHEPCPEGTVLVEGEYCPEVEQVCLEWVDVHGKATKEAIPKPGQTGRCGTWKSPARCLSKKTVHKRFCMDKYEFPNIKGVKPISWISWDQMGVVCAQQGKRLCTRSEWTFACEGPEMQPYPYGDGYHRDKTACNIDNAMPKGIKNILKVSSRESPEAKLLDDLLVASGSMERCVSPFGVYDMVGNLDEPVVNETGHPYHSGLMSGHVFGVRNACRPMTAAHNESFAWYETGGRCCSDVE